MLKLAHQIISSHENLNPCYSYVCDDGMYERWHMNNVGGFHTPDYNKCIG